MDWATSDYTRTYADTIFIPEPGHDSGVSVLDQSDQSDNPENGRDRLRPYGRRGHPEKAAPHRGRRENYYTGGNVVSSRKNLDRVYDVAWDQTPQQYNPNSGASWARLVPNPRDRPYGGGPAPSLAFPMITTSEAMLHPGNSVFPCAPSKECSAGAGTSDMPHSRCSKEGFLGGGSVLSSPITVEVSLQFIKVILLVIIVVLLAMTLAAAGRVERRLEKLARAAAGPAKVSDTGA